MGFFDSFSDDNAIQGIKCDVTNCVHHNGKHNCTAKNISVGPIFANSCSDTVCATFEAK